MQYNKSVSTQISFWTIRETKYLSKINTLPNGSALALAHVGVRTGTILVTIFGMAVLPKCVLFRHELVEAALVAGEEGPGDEHREPIQSHPSCLMR